MVGMREEESVKKVTSLVVEGKRPSGRLKKTWKDTISRDMQLLGLMEEDAF